MQKYSFTIDVTKIDKTKLKERTYQNKEGQDVTVKEYAFEAILNKEEIVKTGDTWEMVKRGFVTGKGVKLEDGKYSKEPIFGDVIEIRDKIEESAPSIESTGYQGDFNGEVDESDIPF
jgi:hypothetical protein